MSQRLPILLILLLGGLNLASAQLTKTIHNSFEVDSLTQIDFNLDGEYTISYWEGNTILTETNIELYDASPNIFKHFIKMGRYDVDLMEDGNIGNLYHKEIDRKPIYTTKGQSWEVIKVKIYVPNSFKETGPDSFVRSVKANSIGQ